MPADTSFGTIAKELTLAAIQKIMPQHNAMDPDRIGKTVGEIYKTVLKHVKSADEE